MGVCDRLGEAAHRCGEVAPPWAVRLSSAERSGSLNFVDTHLYNPLCSAAKWLSNTLLAALV